MSENLTWKPTQSSYFSFSYKAIITHSNPPQAIMMFYLNVKFEID